MIQLTRRPWLILSKHPFQWLQCRSFDSRTLSSIHMMIRTLSLLRSHISSHSRTLSPRCSAHCVSLPASFSRTFSRSSKQDKEEKTREIVSLINRDPESPPQLFVVQPRLRPDTILQPKLNEALCLANSLEEQREGLFDTDFFDKGLPPHVVVQNPAARSPKPRAG